MQSKYCDFCKDIIKRLYYVRASAHFEGAELLKYRVCSKCMIKLLKYCKQKEL